MFHLPLLVGGLITGVVSLLLLAIRDRRGQRLFEQLITGLLLLIAIGFTASFFVATPPPGAVLGGLVPRFDGTESVLLAAAILGATVMPHAVYLHSGLARDRHGHPDADRPALAAAGHPLGCRAGDDGRGRRQRRHAAGGRAQHAGPRRHRFHRGRLRRRARHRKSADRRVFRHRVAGVGFGFGVGGRVCRRHDHAGIAVPVGADAGAPTGHVDTGHADPGVGFDPTRALVLSQVVLSFGIPFALFPLVLLTSNRAVMGADTNHRATTAAGWAVALMISLLNVMLVYLTVRG
ncbi:natural resistance-associated macrophage family protein [Mycobacterium xenopi 4042]|uniref:Natural resistance-associated macrophage family protein n=1 Tax=Mycobacterium xenopi 4042 TaxID=1299334 RepID=X8ADZ2_MYCXE|nr:natural resistance-associated macrophage family protein [Mycobacterium xenopi 4042]